MQTWMLRLDGVLRRRRWVVLGAWIAVLIAAAPFAVRQAEDLSSGGFRVPGSQSTAVTEALQRFPGAQRAQLAAVLVPEPGATAQDLRAAIERLGRAAGDGVALAPAAKERALHQAARGGAVLVPLQANVDEDAAIDRAEQLRKDLALDDGPQQGVSTHLVGQSALWAALQDLSKEDLAKAESAGFPIVLVILLAVFGSFAAAALPLAVGFFSVFITGSLIFALSQAMEMSIYVTNMASMIGIGVAVDYSLFVLARYREEARAGRPPEQARPVAMATSGLAVIFSGLTVIVSLGGLFMVDNTAIRSMALGAILVVAVSLLASATLLPVLIRLLGHRAYVDSPPFAFVRRMFTSRAPRRRGSTRPGYVRRGFWQRWTEAVTRRPVVSVVASSAVLLALAAPALNLHTGTGALRQLPGDHEARDGYAAAAQLTGPGAAAPVEVIVPRAQEPATRAAHERDPEIARVAPARVAGQSALLVAQPRSDGESAQTKAMVERLRESLPASALVGGVTAAQEDLTDLITGSMWKIALFLLGLSYLVLLVLLRSVVLPLKAVLMNLLSVGAAYGVLELAFGTVSTLTLPLVLAVVFGLSMDYEVFLLSRIRERYAATGDTTRAVAEGLAASARTITSAAVIMVTVFAIFVSVGVPSIQHIGLGCAVAIALDATIVRLVLVPAAMKLLGRWNWYLPRPLERILPQADFEALAPSGA
jgi:RND superfamily putative drug exporter